MKSGTFSENFQVFSQVFEENSRACRFPSNDFYGSNRGSSKGAAEPIRRAPPHSPASMMQIPTCRSVQGRFCKRHSKRKPKATTRPYSPMSKAVDSTPKPYRAVYQLPSRTGGIASRLPQAAPQKETGDGAQWDSTPQTTRNGQ